MENVLLTLTADAQFRPNPMLIDYRDLSKEALFSLANEWVISKLSEVEYQPDIAQWTEQTIKKVKKGDLLVEFGEESQTVYLKSKEELGIVQ